MHSPKPLGCAVRRPDITVTISSRKSPSMARIRLRLNSITRPNCCAGCVTSAVRHGPRPSFHLTRACIVISVQSSPNLAGLAPRCCQCDTKRPQCRIPSMNTREGSTGSKESRTKEQGDRMSRQKVTTAKNRPVKYNIPTYLFIHTNDPNPHPLKASYS